MGARRFVTLLEVGRKVLNTHLIRVWVSMAFGEKDTHHTLLIRERGAYPGEVLLAGLIRGLEKPEKAFWHLMRGGLHGSIRFTL